MHEWPDEDNGEPDNEHIDRQFDKSIPEHDKPADRPLPVPLFPATTDEVKLPSEKHKTPFHAEEEEKPTFLDENDNSDNEDREREKFLLVSWVSF